MKTVEIDENFSSYPNGKDERAFTKGEEVELANEHADLLIGKGLAHEKGKVAPKPPKSESGADAGDKKDADA